MNPLFDDLFRMKPALLFIVFFMVPLSAYAHPGKTDYRGGHKCWKNCIEWDLGRGQYHLHDEDWKPVHIEGKENAVKQEQAKGVPTPEKRFLLEDNGTAPNPVTEAQGNRKSNMPEQRAVAAKNPAPSVYEESFLPFNSILLLLLALLLLIVLIYVRKKREKG